MAMFWPLVGLEALIAPVTPSSSWMPLPSRPPARLVNASAVPAPSATRTLSPPAGTTRPACRTSLTLTSKAPFGPEPEFCSTSANVTRLPFSAAVTLLLIGVAARFVELIVPAQRAPAVPGALNVTGPTAAGLKAAVAPFSATTPFTTPTRLGSCSWIWLVAFDVASVAFVVWFVNCAWFVR